MCVGGVALWDAACDAAFSDKCLCAAADVRCPPPPHSVRRSPPPPRRPSEAVARTRCFQYSQFLQRCQTIEGGVPQQRDLVVAQVSVREQKRMMGKEVRRLKEEQEGTFENITETELQETTNASNGDESLNSDCRYVSKTKETNTSV